MMDEIPKNIGTVIRAICLPTEPSVMVLGLLGAFTYGLLLIGNAQREHNLTPF